MAVYYCIISLLFLTKHFSSLLNVLEKWMAHFTFVCTAVFLFTAHCSLFERSNAVYWQPHSLVSVFEQTGSALIEQPNQPRMYYNCYYCYWRAEGSVLLSWTECSIPWHYCPSWVITANLQVNVVRPTTTWNASRSGYLMFTMDPILRLHVFFTEPAFVRTGVFLQCDKAFK